MTIQEALKAARENLPMHKTDPDQAAFESEILLGSVLKKDRTWIVIHDKDVLSKKNGVTFQKLIGRRINHEPIAYIIGSCEFFGHRFFTDKRALIPRPDTEILVEKALTVVTSNSTIIDIGTGTGAIAISLALAKPNATIIASDASTAALQLAKKNRVALKAKNVSFLKGNLIAPALQKKIQKAKHLVLVANLPYLPAKDKRTMQKQVVKFEPASALFAKNAGLDLNIKLLKQLSPLLKKLNISFSLFLEFDPPQSPTLSKLAQSLFPHATVQFHTDLNGQRRFLELTYNH